MIRNVIAGFLMGGIMITIPYVIIKSKQQQNKEWKIERQQKEYKDSLETELLEL